MKVVYTAPNRAHHYRYAGALHAAGCLHAFVSGFPRLSPRASAPEIREKLVHADLLQTIYLASLKAKFPVTVSQWLAYQSKREQDFACRKFIREGADIFMFYNGSGLNSCRYAKKRGVINVVEAVNTHVEYQENLLEAEHRNYQLPWRPFPKYEKNRRLQEYDEADYILLPSDFVKKSFLSKGFPEKKLLKVPYGFSNLTAASTHREYNYHKNSFTVLYVGSLSVRKGIRYMIEAFKKLNHPKKKLVLVGPDAHDGALNGITLTEDIEFTGVLKGDQLTETYQQADLFCLPSIEEGFGLVLGEAFSFGLPIIATCNTGVDDLIIDGEEGFIVPIRDSEALLIKMQMLADNSELQYTMRTKALAKASSLNGWAETGKLLVDTLSELHQHKKVSIHGLI